MFPKTVDLLGLLQNFCKADPQHAISFLKKQSNCPQFICKMLVLWMVNTIRLIIDTFVDIEMWVMLCLNIFAIYCIIEGELPMGNKRWKESLIVGSLTSRDLKIRAGTFESLPHDVSL